MKIINTANAVDKLLLFRKEAAYYRSAKIFSQIQGPELKSATLFPGKLKTPIIYKLK